MTNAQKARKLRRLAEEARALGAHACAEHLDEYARDVEHDAT